MMAEVEGIINSRPLVPIIIDPQADEPFTPNHLLLLRGHPNLSPGLFDKRDSYGKRRWAQMQYLACHFWSRWLKKFLPNLTLRQKWFQVYPNFQEDDVVLLVDDMQFRSKWLQGRVIRTFPDKNGRVRSVLIKTKHGMLKRPITKLCNVNTHSRSLDKTAHNDLDDFTLANLKV